MHERQCLINWIRHCFPREWSDLYPLNFQGHTCNACALQVKQNACTELHGCWGGGVIWNVNMYFAYPLVRADSQPLATTAGDMGVATWYIQPPRPGLGNSTSILLPLWCASSMDKPVVSWKFLPVSWHKYTLEVCSWLHNLECRSGQEVLRKCSGYIAFRMFMGRHCMLT